MQLEIGPGLSRAVGALAVLAPLGARFRVEPVVDEGVRVRAGEDEDRTAVAAVAAARTAARHKLLAAKRHRNLVIE